MKNKLLMLLLAPWRIYVDFREVRRIKKEIKKRNPFIYW